MAARGLDRAFWRIVNGVSAQAAVEEGIVIGGGCTLLRLAQAVDGVKGGLDNDEQKARTRSRVVEPRHNVPLPSWLGGMLATCRLLEELAMTLVRTVL